MAETVATFRVEYTGYLDPAGKPLAPLPGFARDPRALVPLYRAMVLTRTFDAKAIALQRTGRLGTYASSLGQEAVGVGVASAMAEADVLLPTYREQGAQLWRGVSLVELFLYWGGDERGSRFAGPVRDFPVCVPVGTHAAHGVGVAMAIKLRREARAAVCMFGDGATSKGDTYEALNAAGCWKLPMVFVVSNNQWAISVPRRAQTAAETLAQKAIAAGFAGEQVDGNDVIAVHDAAARALARARTGSGPTLIEALTYRMGDHTTADDATRYRADEEVSARWAEDPVARVRSFLAERGVWGKAEEERLLAECAGEVEAAVAAYEATAPEPPSAMFDHLYATLPAGLAPQRAELAGAEPAEAEAEAEPGDA